MRRKSFSLIGIVGAALSMAGLLITTLSDSKTVREEAREAAQEEVRKLMSADADEASDENE